MQKVNLCESLLEGKGRDRSDGLCARRSAARARRGAGDGARRRRAEMPGLRLQPGGFQEDRPARLRDLLRDLCRWPRVRCSRACTRAPRTSARCPARQAQTIERETQLKTLQRDLRKAVSEEDYESAATDPRPIRQLEVRVTRHGHPQYPQQHRRMAARRRPASSDRRQQPRAAGAQSAEALPSPAGRKRPSGCRSSKRSSRRSRSCRR